MSHLADETLQLLADGLLEAAPRAEAEAHAVACPACRAQLAEYRALFSDLAVLPAPPPPMRFTASVMARVEVREAQLARQRRVAVATLAGSALVALVCFSLAGNGAWARQLTGVSSGVLQLGRLTHLLVEALIPVLSAWRLPLVAALAAVCIPTLMALHRSMAPRAQAA